MASGLVIQWAKSEARWLAPLPRPQFTNALQWSWKDVDSPGQLLDFSFIDGLHDNDMFLSLLLKLKERLQHWNWFQVSLHGKIVITNHLVASSLWYVLTLVASDLRKLNKLQQLLVSFVWGKEGRKAYHKVLQNILTLSKRRGGLGLIDVTLQVKALCSSVSYGHYSSDTTRYNDICIMK